MKKLMTLLAMSAVAVASGCGSTPTDTETVKVPPSPAPMKGAPTNAAPANANARSGQADATLKQTPPPPTIPAGARFTIFCESFAGPDHVKRATDLKNILMTNAQAKGWYVIHQDGQSTLYHGYYKEFDVEAAPDAATKKDAARAQSDKKLVESIPSPLSQDRRLFPRALFVSLDSPDIDAPAEWNLVNTKAAWSVQIAVYSGYDRKQAAVESVREARKLNIPAFYYHGPSYSHVCIGSWPATAVRDQSTEQINTIPENSSVFVDLRGGAIPQEFKDIATRDGKPVQVVQPKIEILDPTLLDTLKRYPEHNVDGYVDMERRTDAATGKEVSRPRRSMLVRVPESDLLAESANQSPEANEPTLIAPAPTNSNLGARLRGLNP